MAIEFDNAQAGKEGWGIFDCEGSANGPWQLQKEDIQDVFATDCDAWQHVVACADAGSAYHLAALEFLLQHNPQEHSAIFRKVR
jgi:hypothetical protein